jgi:hypothetical protein
MTQRRKRGQAPAPGRGRPPAKPQQQAPASSWRELGTLERFTTLLNHYGSAQALADATGIPARSLRAVFTSAVLNGKQSRVLESDAYKQAFRHARHRMTDHMRRSSQAAQRGDYAAPVVRTGTSLIVPEVRRFTIEYVDPRGKIRTTVSKSQWFLYNVEFMSLSEIATIIANLYDVFMDTGQFNTMRMEYIVGADRYFDGQYIHDKTLRNAAREMEYIKLSTGQRSFTENYNGPDYAAAWMAEWKSIPGAERITTLCFAQFDDIAQGDTMRLAKRDFDKYKKRKGKGGDGKRKGKGRGI